MAKKQDVEHVFSPSQLDCSACRRRYYWSYIKEYQPRRRNWNMIGGSMIHAALEQWYNTGDQKKAIAAAVKYAADETALGFMSVEDEFDRDKYVAMCKGLIPSYASHYKADAKWSVVAVEAEFDMVRIAGHLFSGVIDLLAADAKGRLFVVDHKSKSRVTGDILAAFPLQHQTTIYLAAASIIAGKPVHNMTYNIFQKPGIYQGKKETCAEFLRRLEGDVRTKPEKYLMRQPVTVNEKRLDALLTNVREKCKMLTKLIQHNRMCEWFREPSICTQYGKACEFLPLCHKGEKADVKLLYQPKVRR